jgi:MFS family permease
MTDPKSTKLLLALLFTGTLMGALDLAIIGPALPVIQAEFGMQQRELAGLINSYTLLQMLGALLLAKFADRVGPRLIYIISISLFATGSLQIVLAESAWMLNFGRAMQGFGAGGVFPAAASVIGARLPPKERGPALGILGAVWGIAFLIGPILGGIFLRFSWQWLFAINLPIALVLIIGAMKMLPGHSGREPAPFDIKGTILLMLGLSALMLAVSNLDSTAPLESLLSLPVSGGMIMLVLVTAIFWQVEKRAQDPIVMPTLFNSAQVRKSCIISVGVSAIQAGTIFIPALLVISLDVSPANSALLLLPGVIAATIMAPVAGRLINKTGTRLILVVSQILMLISLAVYAFTDLSMTSFIIVSILAGIGSAGLVGAPLRFIMLAESGASDRASAQGVISVTSSMGRIFGASAVGAVAASYGGDVVGYQAAFTGLVVLGIIVMLAAITLNSKAAEDSAAEAKLA